MEDNLLNLLRWLAAPDVLAGPPTARAFWAAATIMYEYRARWQARKIEELTERVAELQEHVACHALLDGGE